MPSNKTLNVQKLLENPDFDVIDKQSQTRFLESRCKELLEYEGALGVDTETTGLDPVRNQVRLIQIATPDYCLIVDLDGFRRKGVRQVDWEQRGLASLKAVLESTKLKVLQNAAFDLNMLKGEGVELNGHLFDTMLCAKVVNNGSGAKNGLGDLVKRYLKVEIDKSNQKEDWSQPELPQDMLQYAARDAIVLPRLHLLITARLQECKLAPVAMGELKALRAVADMQWNGMGFDREAARELEKQLIIDWEKKRLAFVELLDEKMRARGSEGLPRDPDGTFNLRAKDEGRIKDGTKKYKGFNPDSSMQMINAFLAAGVVLSPNEKGKYTVDQNLLAFVARDMKEMGLSTELLDSYLAWKETSTLRKHIKTLLEAADDRDRIHAGYRQLGTETGRLSCAGPNLQQVPRTATFRSLFKAAPGHKIVGADFSQIELRVAADLSAEPAMRNSYNNGEDLHRRTAALMLKKEPAEVTKDERQSAKIANFGLLFGAGPGTLLKQAISQYKVDWSIDDAKKIVNGFREAYPTLLKWQQQTGERQTNAIFTKSGRRRQLTERTNKFTTRINTEVQGTAGDIAKLALMRVWKYLATYPGEARIVGIVHDELILEVKDAYVPQWEKRLVLAMENAGKELIKSVPIIAEVNSGNSWAEAH